MNVIDFKKARVEKLVRDLQRLTREHEGYQEAQQWALLSVGFKFPRAGEDRWGGPVYSVLHNGNLIVDGHAELDLDEALDLAHELLEYCASPDEYRQHAEGFMAAVAELHAEADAAIEASRE